MRDCCHLTSFGGQNVRNLLAAEVDLRAIFLAKTQMEERKYDFFMTQMGVHAKHSFDFNSFVIIGQKLKVKYKIK